MSNSDKTIASLEVVPIRQAFPNEARHFTTWLETNINALSDRINMTLTVIEREKAVGSFNVDLLCEDDEGDRVIIENQLERSDHSHLGQLLTYLVNLEAKTAVWIMTEPRPEHQKVINWLNENTPADTAFYLVKAEAIRIADSPYAPLFTVMAGPDRQAKEVGDKKKEWADRQYANLEFWKSLLERSKQKTKLFTAISPSREYWLGIGAGITGLAFTYVILREQGGVELYIDSTKDQGLKNKQIFDRLFEQKVEIEQEFGDTIDWERLEGKRACRIRKRYDIGGLADPDSWSTLQDQMIETMIKFERIFRPRLNNINV
ncbi:MAG: DUF4268 domain-containing protein [Chloroflexi bacterium]|nr:DUF4268 domain-containing protein [Chloroflexota bacterium]